MRNTALRALIDGVLDESSPSLTTINVELLSGIVPEFSFSPLLLDGYTIEQYFSDSFADRITVSFPISPIDYISLYNSQQDLYAVITTRKLDRNGNVDEREAPKVRKYRAHLMNPRDLRKDMPDADLREDLKLSADLQLMSEEIYNSRLIRFYGTYLQTNVAKIIQMAASHFKTLPLGLTPPDNVATYDQIVIPPSKGLADLFDFLQTTYGIYGKGMNHYYSEGAMWIYPAYDVDAVGRTKTLSFYGAYVGDFAGMSSYFKQTGDQTEIVLTGLTNATDLSQEGAENVGTSLMFLRASQIKDGFTKLVGDKIVVVSEPALALKTTTPRTAGNVHNNVFRRPTDNPFKLASEIAAYQSTLIDVGWAMAVPYLILPGAAGQYSFDDNGMVKTVPVIVESVVYYYRREAIVSEGQSYSCKAEIRLRGDFPKAATSGA